MPLDGSDGRQSAVTIQSEPYDDVLRDGVALFREHCLAVGEAADEYQRKNLPLMAHMDKLGMTIVLTARSNGRMFGYLMAIVGPSLEVIGRTVATQTLFFVSADAPGVMLGMQLQAEMLKACKDRGIGQIIMRAGVRGAGPDLGPLYQYFGAEPFGQLYNLMMEDA